MKHFLGALLILVTLCSNKGLAQSTNNIGLFPTIDHSGTISKKFDYSLYYFGAINLFNSKINNAQQNTGFFAFYAEQALTYKINSQLSFTASYVYERQNPTYNNYRNENRFYLQSTYKHLIKASTLKHRLRFDGRFVENRVTKETPFTSRVRYLIGLQTPIQYVKDKLYFTAYNEFFFNTENKATPTYAENWAYAGLGYKINKSNTIEAGPLYIAWANNKQGDYTNLYYLQFSWITHIDYRKKPTK